MATRSLKAQLELSADASGVEAGVTRAQRSLTDLGVTAAAAGRQASTGLASAGDGGDKASAKVDAATRSIAGSIQRTTAVLEAGGRGTSAYFKALASQRGIDPEALKPYLDQLDAVAAKQKLVQCATLSLKVECVNGVYFETREEARRAIVECIGY